MLAPKPKAYSYLRFSTPEQKQGDSGRRQTTLAREYAEKHGLDLDAQLAFNDEGVSAYRGKNSETGKLGEFLGAVRTGIVPPGAYLLVESLDRISRQAARKAQRVLEDICEEGVTVVTLTDGRAYTKELLDSDPTALLMSLLIFIRANEESTMKSRRLKAAWTGKRQRASSEPITAKCPGWVRLNKATGKWALIPERAEVVQRVFRESLEGRGQHTITQGLNRDAIPVFGKAGHWHRSYVAKLLSNPAVMGTYVPHSLEWLDGKRARKALDPIQGYFPAVVDSETYQRVQALRMDAASPQRGRHAGKDLRNIFGGLLRCSECGGAMVMVNKGKRSQPYVVCGKAKTGAGCGYRAVRYERLEYALLNHAPQLLAIIPGGGSEEGEEVQAELDRAEAALDAADDLLAQLGEDYRNTRLRTLLTQIQEVEQERDALKAKRDELVERRDATVGPFLEQRASEALSAVTAEPLDRKRANVALRTVLASVTVNPRGGLMVLRWKHGGEAQHLFSFPEE
ncbi:recombinase family protein [Stigmatella sp. ncwal1]|uniref:Recombinase family protein n=1 Tax=Stigmatella ashevillensis TaxID=2995309 RepID=A0ABT5DLK3_9BACT|nr:recombinase family protein [Stigmatella ashevillena]MDC0714020.1 recombinase family protein [Stigmatella ashevillena]